jgi:hypothetical protein
MVLSFSLPVEANCSAAAQYIFGNSILFYFILFTLDSPIFARFYINSRPRLFTYNVGSPLNVIQRLYG